LKILWLLLICLFYFAPVTPSFADFTSDWTATKAELARPEANKPSLSISGLKGYFPPLDQRLKQILKSQQAVLSLQKTPRFSSIEWAAQQLFNAQTLATSAEPWKSHPKHKELLALLQAAASAQQEANLSLQADQQFSFEKSQKRAAQKTQAALELLSESKKDEQKPSDQEQKKQEKDNQQAKKPGEQAQKDQKKSNKDDQQADPSKENRKEETKDHKKKQGQSEQKAKEALKKLLKLQQQANKEKEFRKKRLGFQQRGQQAVEKDW